MVRMGRGSTLDLNTYFNSFYEQFWIERTTARSFSWQLHMRGYFNIKIFRERYNKKPVLLAESVVRQTSDSDKITLKLPYSEGPCTDLGRIYLQFNAIEDGEFLGGRLVTETKPHGEVILGLISVTYKKEVFIRALIDQWARDEALIKKNTAFFVVDNGSTLDQSEFTDARLRIIPNRNLGGSGGFNRGLLEASDHGGFTHYLLMDDDILIDAESILRLITFYEYAAEEYSVAGTMLDINDPMHFLGYGGTFGAIANGRKDPIFFMRSMNANYRLDRPNNLNAMFAKEAPLDFAGFWFYGFPAAWLKQSGYIMPFFIHSDDIEFCLRQRLRHGKTITCLPSVAVWHHSHTTRTADYRPQAHIIYYNIRNMTATYFLHGNIPVLRLIAALTLEFIKQLLTFNYEQAAWIALAVRHAIEGPDFLSKTDPASLHETIREKFSGLNDSHKSSAPVSRSEIMNLFRPPPRTFWRKCAAIATLNGHLIPDALLKEGPVLFFDGQWQRLFGFKKSLLAQDASDLLEFRMRRRICLQLLAEWIGLCLKLLFAGRRLKTAWREAQTTLTEPGFVRKFTGKDDRINHPDEIPQSSV